MNLFIDTNIYLNFYHYTNDNLKELKKLVDVIKSGEVRLFITRQVIEEFIRNRESIISKALKQFEDQKLNNSFPRIFDEYEERKALQRFVEEYNECKKSIVEKVKNDATGRKLMADHIITDLFSNGILEIDSEILTKAKNRIDRGNPPGKNNSYGDAINWEILISNTPDNKDLHFIAGDKDYISPINKKQMNIFLSTEWEQKKHSSIHVYNSLSEFFTTDNLKIVLNDEPVIKYLNFDNIFNIKAVFGESANIAENQYIFRYLDLNNNGQFEPGEPFWIINPSLQP